MVSRVMVWRSSQNVQTNAMVREGEKIDDDNRTSSIRIIIMIDQR